MIGYHPTPTSRVPVRVALQAWVGNAVRYHTDHATYHDALSGGKMIGQHA